MRTSASAALLLAALLLAGCGSLVAPPYVTSEDNSAALKKLGTKGIALGAFGEPPEFNSLCRGVGSVRVPDGLTHAQYIRKAFEEEFKTAGTLARTPRVTLTGQVTRLEFSSTLGGSWRIDLTLAADNGKSVSVSEQYEFTTPGLHPPVACRQAAASFTPAVQKLIGRVFASPQFQDMLR